MKTISSVAERNQPKFDSTKIIAIENIQETWKIGENFEFVTRLDLLSTPFLK